MKSHLESSDVKREATAMGVLDRHPTIRKVDVLVPADIDLLVNQFDLPHGNASMILPAMTHRIKYPLRRRRVGTLHHRKLFVESEREIMKPRK